jgi:sugar-specific transcriptional regulator TrmB
MNTAILVEAGLTEAEATAYTFLVENSPIAPPRLAELIMESRTNTYKLLESLEELGLAQKDESDKKLKYWAKNPSTLLQHVKEKQEQAELKTKKLQSSLPSLVNTFLKHNEQPGVRFYQGKTGISEMYQDQLNSAKQITMVRSLHDIEFFGGFPEISKIREEFNKSSISRHMITPDSKEARIDWKNHDKKSSNTRTWLRANEYTSAVEWAVYDNNLAIISFGQEAIGMIIESQQIADSFLQILNLVSDGSKSKKDYHLLPKLVSHKD